MFVVDRPDMQLIKPGNVCVKMLVVRALANKLAQKFNLLIQSKVKVMCKYLKVNGSS